MATQDDYIRTALRVPPDLHRAIHDSAAAHQRTFNAEILARLRDSFQHPQVSIPSSVQEAIAEHRVQWGSSTEEALEQLVRAGQSPRGTVLHVTVAPGASLHDLRRMLKAAEGVPGDALVAVGVKK